MKLNGLILLVLFCKLVMLSSPRDVCILGSGASGMSAAVFLKDKGYDVVVLEKDGEVGGHCETFYFTPPSPDLQNWLELGVQVFPDTALENATGIGNWTLGSREFAQRFLPENSTIAYAPNVTNYGFDFIHQYNLGRLASSPPTQDYIDAFIRFNTILDTYPWLDNVHFPDPIPQELLVPFSEFTDANNLTAIESFFFPLLYFGGMGNYKNITTLYALQNLRRGITSIYTNSSYGFTIKGGCTKIYEGISEYLGEENILLNVQDMKVTRSNNRTSISFGQTGKCSNSTLRCRNLVVAFPQLLNQLDFIDLREEERDIFKDVIANNYYNFGLNVNGPIADNTSFNLASVDIQSPDGIPPFPNILALRREIEYGPAVGYAYADEQKSICYMQHLVDDFLRRLPPSLLNETSIFEFDYHYYQAHFTVEALNMTPTPYTRLDQLQGKRNTYWTGALFSFAETASIWQKTKDLIDQHFPNKQ